jgi:hypothetical protein
VKLKSILDTKESANQFASNTICTCAIFASVLPFKAGED